MLLSLSSLVALSTLFLQASSSPVPQTKGINDFDCKSQTQPIPVVLFHGLGVTNKGDVTSMQNFLASKGFCTFATTYGTFEDFDFIGGLQHIDVSSQQLADYVLKVVQKTGSDKIDIVGHSEGAFQSLYVPKFTSAKPHVRKVFAIAPPTHGTDLSRLVDLITPFASNATIKEILDAVHCHACEDLKRGGAAVTKLNTGPIAQSGIKYTVLTSTANKIITPAPDASFVQEPGVTNILYQHYCPKDTVGHLGEVKSENSWNLVLNELQDQPDRPFDCFEDPDPKGTKSAVDGVKGNLAYAQKLANLTSATTQAADDEVKKNMAYSQKLTSMTTSKGGGVAASGSDLSATDPSLSTTTLDATPDGGKEKAEEVSAPSTLNSAMDGGVKGQLDYAQSLVENPLKSLENLF